MNRKNAKEIAKTITNEQLKQMLNKAQDEVTDWKQPSLVNKGLTKGVAWNILGEGFNVNDKYHILAKINMVREFGKYLPTELIPIKKEKSKSETLFHQEPKFKNI